MAFASFGAKIDEFKSKSPYVFKIHGQTYHYTSSLFPEDGETPKYEQLYILDTKEAIGYRMNSKLMINELQIYLKIWMIYSEK